MVYLASFFNLFVTGASRGVGLLPYQSWLLKHSAIYTSKEITFFDKFLNIPSAFMLLHIIRNMIVFFCVLVQSTEGISYGGLNATTDTN